MFHNTGKNRGGGKSPQKIFFFFKMGKNTILRRNGKILGKYKKNTEMFP